jgi:hypothetical protein
VFARLLVENIKLIRFNVFVYIVLTIKIRFVTKKHIDFFHFQLVNASRIPVGTLETHYTKHAHNFLSVCIACQPRQQKFSDTQICRNIITGLRVNWMI